MIRHPIFFRRKICIILRMEVIEKTYSQITEEIEAFGTSLLKLGLENKKVAVILLLRCNTWEYTVNMYIQIYKTGMLDNLEEKFMKKIFAIVFN